MRIRVSPTPSNTPSNTPSYSPTGTECPTATPTQTPSPSPTFCFEPKAYMLFDAQSNLLTMNGWMASQGSSFRGMFANGPSTNPSIFASQMNAYIDYSGYTSTGFNLSPTTVTGFNQSPFTLNSSVVFASQNVWVNILMPTCPTCPGGEYSLMGINNPPPHSTNPLYRSFEFYYSGVTIPQGFYRLYTTYAGTAMRLNNSSFQYVLGGLQCPTTPTPTTTPTQTRTPSPTTTQTQTPSPTATPFEVCPNELFIDGLTGAWPYPDQTYYRLTSYTGGTFTGGYRYFDGITTTFVPGASPSGDTYSVFVAQSGSTYYTLIAYTTNLTSYTFRMFSSTDDYIINGGTLISSTILNTTPSTTLVGGVLFPNPGRTNTGWANVIYPSLCPTITPTPSQTATLNATPTQTSTQTETPTMTSTPTRTPEVSPTQTSSPTNTQTGTPSITPTQTSTPSSTPPLNDCICYQYTNDGDPEAVNSISYLDCSGDFQQIDNIPFGTSGYFCAIFGSVQETEGLTYIEVDPSFCGGCGEPPVTPTNTQTQTGTPPVTPTQTQTPSPSGDIPCIQVIDTVIAPEPQTGPNNFFGVNISLSPYPIVEDITVTGYIRDDGDITNIYIFSITIPGGSQSGETANNVLTTGPADTATIFVTGITPTVVTYAGNSVNICGFEPEPTPTMTNTPSKTPTMTPTPSTTPPCSNTIYTHGALRPTCSDFCNTNYLIGTTDCATETYFNLSIGDFIYGYSGQSGYLAYSNVSTDTNTGPFRIADIDGSGEILGLYVCSGGSCIPL